MKRSTIILTILISLSFFATLVPGAALNSPSNNSIREMPGEFDPAPANSADPVNYWWDTWFRDTDGNRIDDLIKDNRDGSQNSFPVFINYKNRPTNTDLASLEAMDVDISYTAKFISTICADSVPYDSIVKISKLPNVVLVELQPEIDYHMDVSAPSLRSRGSDNYSPFTGMDIGYSGRDVNIAIIDTGVDDTVHQSLRGKFRGGANLAGALNLNNTNPNDDFGHGTHVSGIAMGTGGRDGTYMGVAPNASLIDVKISNGLGGNILQGLDWVIENKESRNISIVSMSVGGSYSSDGTDSISREANKAVEAGMIVMSSAGNDGTNMISAPAAADLVLAIGATTHKDTVTRSDDVIAGYSNFGPRKSDNDGVSWDERKPELVAPGTNIMAPKFNSVDNYIALTGTSMSCPAVAGIAALMLEANPYLTPADIRQIFIDTSEARGTPSDPDDHPKFNNKYGYGIVDAYGAVKRAEDLASAKLTGPAEVEPGKDLSFQYKFDLSRTEHTNMGEVVRISLTAPSSWVKPDKIIIDDGAGTSGVSAGSIMNEPVKSGGQWNFGAVLTYDGKVSEPVTLTPTITFQSSVTDNARNDASYTFLGSFDINGAKSQVTEFLTGVEPTEENIDLVVTTNDITFSNENPVFNENVVIKARINNTGSSEALGVRVNFSDGPPRTGRVIDSVIINKIPGQSSAVAQVTWQAVPGIHTIYVHVDPFDWIVETNENNNIAPSQPIVVQGGVNSPPVADLQVTPRTAFIGQPVTFDGSGSFDNDGDVVKFLFDYGNGENSSWIDMEAIQYVYLVPGSYRTTLRVEDNGGQKSVPDTFLLNVTEREGGVEQLYYYMNSNLLDTAPYSTSFNYVPIPNSMGGSVIPQWKYVGNWSTRDPLESIEMDETAYFFGWVQNTGNTPTTVMQLEFTLMVNGQNVTQPETVLLPDSMEPAGDPTPVTTEAALSTYRLKPNDVVTVVVRSLVNSDDIVFVFGSQSYSTRVEFIFNQPELQAPVANAGEDVSVFAEETVSFNGLGTDTDGQILLYQWDFEGDGVFDFESTTTGSTTFAYPQPGVYDARFQVTDDDALSDIDERKITVNSGAPNQPPTVDITEPKNNANVVDTTMIKGYAEDDMVVTSVQVSINSGEWTNAKKETVGSGIYTWELEWDTTTVPNGKATIKARAYDGEMFSGDKSISVNVDNKIAPPEIDDADVRPSSVPNDDETQVKITVEVLYDGVYEDLTVLADMREIGGKKSQELYDDESHGDKKDGDGEYTLVTTVPEDVEPGDKMISIIVEDPAGDAVETDLSLTVTEAGKQGNAQPKILLLIAEPDLVPNDGDTNVVFKVTVEDLDGVEDIRTVSIDLSPLGLSRTNEMSDDGQNNGDETAGDGIFTFTARVPASVQPGEVRLEVIVTDISDESTFGFITLTVEQYVPGQGTEDVSDAFSFLWDQLLLVVAVIGLIIFIIIMAVIARVMRTSKKKERAAQDAFFQNTEGQQQEN